MVPQVAQDVSEAVGSRLGQDARHAPPAGASSVETQETKLARPVHTASPAEKILQRVLLIGAAMAIRMPEYYGLGL